MKNDREVFQQTAGFGTELGVGGVYHQVLGIEVDLLSCLYCRLRDSWLLVLSYSIQGYQQGESADFP